MKKNILFIFYIFLMGCFFMKNSFVFVENIGEKKIYDVTVASQKGFWFSFGDIRPDTESGYLGPYEYPYNDKYTVSWLDSEKSRHEKSIDFGSLKNKKIPNNAELIFRINRNNELSFEFKEIVP